MRRRVIAFAAAILLIGAGTWFGSTLGLLQVWLLGAGLVGLIGVATEVFTARPPEQDPASHLEAFSLWIAPGLLTVAWLWLVRSASADLRPQLVAAGVLAMGALFAALLASRESSERVHRSGRFGVNLIVFISVFLLFALIYQTKERSLLTATATGAVALLAGLELIRPQRGDFGAWSLVAVLSLVIAETTWAMNYWPVNGLVGGALLLMAFYVLSGLIQMARQGTIDRRMLLEYGTVGLVGFAAVLWAIPW